MVSSRKAIIKPISTTLGIFLGFLSTRLHVTKLSAVNSMTWAIFLTKAEEMLFSPKNLSTGLIMFCVSHELSLADVPLGMSDWPHTKARISMKRIIPNVFFFIFFLLQFSSVYKQNKIPHALIQSRKCEQYLFLCHFHV